MVARDTVVAERIADRLRAQAKTALVVAGEHAYGRQLDEQLAAAGLARTDDRTRADVVVLAGLEGEAEIDRAAALSPLPVIAFDGVQGAPLGEARDVQLAVPIAPRAGIDSPDLFAGVESARNAAELVEDALAHGARDRAAMLAALRESRPFDDNGNPRRAGRMAMASGRALETRAARSHLGPMPIAAVRAARVLGLAIGFVRGAARR